MHAKQTNVTSSFDRGRFTLERRSCPARKVAVPGIDGSWVFLQSLSTKCLRLSQLFKGRFCLTYRILGFPSGYAHHHVRREDVLREVNPKDIVNDQTQQKQCRYFQIRQSNKCNEGYAQTSGDDCKREKQITAVWTRNISLYLPSMNSQCPVMIQIETRLMERTKEMISDNG